MRTKTIFPLFLLLLTSLSTLSAQDLLTELEKEHQDAPIYTAATFKTTRLSIGHSLETRKKNILEISAANSFWNLPIETSNSFIADKMSTRFGLAYSITDRLTIGTGASTLDGVFDSFLKFRLLRQRDDANGSPLGITFVQAGSYRSKQFGNLELRDSFGDKLAFTSQLIIGRKFTSDFSFQISPTFVHRNSSRFEEDPSDQFALGFGGRYKVGSHLAVVSEYYYVANPLESQQTFGAFALGANWELSDLMLQFKMTNSPFFAEDAFITRTRKNFNFKDGNFFFVFHATYVLHL